MERFLSCVDKNGPIPKDRPDLGPCWLWTAALNPYGYAVFWVDDHQVRSHRWMYEQSVGPFGDGYEPDHLCHTVDMECLGGNSCPHRGCVNPAHIEAVTPEENKRRAFDRRKKAGILQPSRYSPARWPT